MYKFVGLLFHRFMNSTFVSKRQKTMPRDAERPFASCKHGKAKRAKTRKKQANSADIGTFCGPARGHPRTADDARW